MRVAIIGIGGVGGYYGGKLAHRFPPGGDHEIIFYCRGAHMDAIRRNGLNLIAKDGDLVAHPAMATDSADVMGVVDVAFFAVKGYSQPEAARAMRPAIGSSTIVIPLGNGVENDEILRREIGSGRVLNGAVYISTHIGAPGVVEQTGGSRKLFFGSPDGEVDPYRPIAQMLKAAAIDAELSGDIQRDVWSKFIFIDAISAATSLHGVTIGTVLATPALQKQLTDLMCEVQSLGDRLNVGLPAGIIDQAVERAGAFPPDTKTSMQLDVEKGNPTELDTMLGYVVRKGKELGIDTPTHVNVYEALSKKAR